MNWTNIPPQRILLIVGGGVGLGLLWRRFSGSRNVVNPDAADGSLSYPDDINSLPLDTIGNRRDLVSGGNYPTIQNPPTTDENGNPIGADGVNNVFNDPQDQVITRNELPVPGTNPWYDEYFATQGMNYRTWYNEQMGTNY